ncbi:MAG: type IV pilus modification protein PilV [Gammaproteobacteria bacterium]
MSLMNHSRPIARSLMIGTSLIEVLVALVILSGGMLGIAGVHAVSLRANQAAYYRTLATTLSTDMIERMRANKTGVDLGAYDDVAGGATADCFTVASCSPAEMAAQDILDWEAQVAAMLPSAASVVCVDSTGNDGTAAANACDGLGNVYAIKIWWDDDRDGVSDPLYVTTMQPL